uniref:Cyclin N-terminal domain containing 1 n=1 Tax=Kryptolebias marmoratus TaxID=37003 RepID=A0A3Q3F7T0_KRYMA
EKERITTASCCFCRPEVPLSASRLLSRFTRSFVPPRFMVRRVWDCLATPTAGGAAGDEPASYEDAIFDRLKDNFPLIIFSSVQLANKLFLHSHKIHINAAVLFLRSIGVRASKQTVLESELMVFKGLEFNLNVPNPLTYVEVLLEVLGYNEPDVPIENLYQRCLNVLQFVTLERTAIYEALLRVTTQSVSPSREQREKFVTVTEDCMLLGVGVIAVATFICLFQDWEEVRYGFFKCSHF